MFFLTFFPLYTWLLFRHTWLIFLPKSDKTPLKIPKEMMLVWNTFIIFSQSFAEDTWNSLLATLPNAKFLVKYGFFAQRPKKIKQLFFFPKKTSERFAAPVGCTSEKFWQKNHAKSPKISLKEQKIWAKFLHSKETS